MLSVVIPLYNEEKIIKKLYEALNISLSKDFEQREYIFVDDGSSDKTLAELLSIQKKDSNVIIVELSRNFGHQAAYTAGLENAKGDYIVMMDGDLQDPPELIPEMFNKLKNDDFDVVYGKRTDRKESFLKKAQIKLFHYIFKKVNNINAPANVGNFSIMTRGALDAFLRLKEKNRYLPGLRFFIGFKQGFVEYSRPDRKDGEAKMSNLKLIKLAFDAIFSFSKLPIKLALIIGTLGIFISIIGAGIVLYKYIIGVAITGWTSTMLALFFFGSIQLFFLGILGEYVFRIYTETKDRPIYIIRNKLENN
ncbi:MAG TPA: glycosyltransferase [Bacteroidales bacterium]|nr:MAG: hypothetical protein A2W98_08670 [Bacteroidetes bacterium GWF2_33_38]OFY75871.1 MAG: hypothetical protein A2265_00130 [Bacteroidetes bacterium RIFOXYA12_FULL_33_9]OFY92233.1 MAG: hypothetical protein A2236_04935 [Bacteroidetes bacterium RIFOXYA2_FULL_33_7]HBF87396.1 glycosyltransferase [Bacteroidales bacterium]